MKTIEHILGEISLRFFINDNNEVSMYMVPKSRKGSIKNGWEYKNDPWSTTEPYMRQWRMGRLVHFHLAHHSLPVTGGDSLKFSGESGVFFKNQTVTKTGNTTEIKTFLTSFEGHSIVNVLTYTEGYNAVLSRNEFTNTSDKDVVMDYIASFAFENLSPFSERDSRNRLVLHRFTGGWSMEGRHQSDSLERLAIEKSWQGYCNDKSLRFGSIGSYTNRTYLPLVVIEDKKQHVFWAAQIYCNSSWQCDVSRDSDSVSFSGGLADGDFGQWYKVIKPGETFVTPSAAVNATGKDLAYACQSLVKLQNISRKKYGEKGYPITFNEYCSTWEKPTQEKFLSYARKAAEFGVKYVVIDAGWYNTKGIGGWEIDKEKFPDMKAMNRELRSMGLIPGIWFEPESTTAGAKEFGEEFDDLHLKKRGTVIKVGGNRSFWDLKNTKVKKMLQERVIDMLKDNGFGYVKIDYNANIGVGCDGFESLGEGLRRQGEESYRLFQKIKQEIPDIIIENCASGGNRNNPLMLGVSAVASFSDAHECVEIPIIAADLHNHLLPAQALIWAVLHSTDSEKRLHYSLCAGLFGRLCLSGDIDRLSSKQERTVKEFIGFYRKVTGILENGITRTYRRLKGSYRYPEGSQVSVRNTENELLAVCHAFEKPYTKQMCVKIPNGFEICSEFGGKAIQIDGNRLIVSPMDPLSACAIYAIKKEKNK